MRKIISKEEKNKGNQLIIGIILISVMFFGTLGYAFGNKEPEKIKVGYNGVDFLQDDIGYWSFNINGYNFITKYNAKETENISFFIHSSINDYANQPLYFVGGYPEPNYEIRRNLNQFTLRFNDACLDENNCELDLPVKNCSEDNIIAIKEPEDEPENIYQEENCVFITAYYENQTMYADSFLFKILGI